MGWPDFIPGMKWNDYVSSISWGAYISSIDWSPATNGLGNLTLSLTTLKESALATLPSMFSTLQTAIGSLIASINAVSIVPPSPVATIPPSPAPVTTRTPVWNDPSTWTQGVPLAPGQTSGITPTAENPWRYKNQYGQEFNPHQLHDASWQEIPFLAEGGVTTGPNAGYAAILHGTEATVPLSGGRSIPVEIKGGNNVILIEEIRKLREELKAGNTAIAKNTLKSAKLLDRFDVDGLPATRVLV